jgi:hypothetical protein
LIGVLKWAAATILLLVVVVVAAVVEPSLATHATIVGYFARLGTESKS